MLKQVYTIIKSYKIRTLKHKKRDTYYYKCLNHFDFNQILITSI